MTPAAAKGLWQAGRKFSVQFHDTFSESVWCRCQDNLETAGTARALPLTFSAAHAVLPRAKGRIRRTQGREQLFC